MDVLEVLDDLDVLGFGVCGVLLLLDVGVVTGREDCLLRFGGTGVSVRVDGVTGLLFKQALRQSALDTDVREVVEVSESEVSETEMLMFGPINVGTL